MKSPVDLPFSRVIPVLLVVKYAFSVPLGFKSYPNQNILESSSVQNVTLDTLHDKTVEWTISPRNTKQWFEYYNNTGELMTVPVSNNTRCAHAVSQSVTELTKVDGIWAACHNQTLSHNECSKFPRSNCHFPEISYSFAGTSFPHLNVIKLTLAMRGLALVRLRLGSVRGCFDFSVRQDTVSECKFIQVDTLTDGQLKWQEVQFGLDQNDQDPFGSFVIQLITGHEHDVVLIDKVESYKGRGPTVDDEDGSDQFTQSPYLYEETTVDNGITLNKTLDIKEDVRGEWTSARLSDGVPKYFEYYSTTDLLKANATNTKVCAHVMADSLNSLAEVNGIWAACQDPALPTECYISTREPCHPFITHKSGGSSFPTLQTVKIQLAVQGLAIVRLSIGTENSKECFDYSTRKDPFSPCKFIQVKNASESGWTEVQTTYDGYDHIAFSSFTIHLIARFKDDVVLVDKVEATNYRLCGGGILCTTTPSGPTQSHPTMPTNLPTTTTTTTTEGSTTVILTTTTELTTTSSTESTLSSSTSAETTSTPTTPPSSTTTSTPTTPCPTTTPTTTTTVRPSTAPSSKPTTCRPKIRDLSNWEPNKVSTTSNEKNTTLETVTDAENEEVWVIPSLNQKWLEYYRNSDELKGEAGDANSCASIIASAFANLTAAEGIWSSCQGPDEETKQLSSHPVIHYSSEKQLIISVNIRFYLHGRAILRFQLGSQCFDASVEQVPLSPCKFMKIRQDEIHWRGVHETTGSYPYNQIKELRIDLLSRSVGDVILLDRVVVKYMPCDNGDCSLHTPTTEDPTTVETIVECEEEDNTASTTSSDTESTTEGDTESPVTSTENPPCTTSATTGQTDKPTPSPNSGPYLSTPSIVLNSLVSTVIIVLLAK